jgi:hypothetical protein
VVGELTGERLEVLPSQILSWEQFQRLHPGGAVLSRDTGFERDYGQNPYPGYDSDPDSDPFLLDEEPDRSLPPKQRVAAIQTGDGSAVVYPFSRLAGEAPVNDEIAGDPVVVLFDPDVASALDDLTVSGGQEVGAAAVFDRRADGRTLDFEPGRSSSTVTDSQTGSTWSMSGESIAGPLEGKSLDQIAHDDQFWFAIAAFYPEAEVRG